MLTIKEFFIITALIITSRPHKDPPTSAKISSIIINTNDVTDVSKE